MRRAFKVATKAKSSTQQIARGIAEIRLSMNIIYNIELRGEPYWTPLCNPLQVLFHEVFMEEDLFSRKEETQAIKVLWIASINITFIMRQCGTVSNALERCIVAKVNPLFIFCFALIHKLHNRLYYRSDVQLENHTDLD